MTHHAFIDESTRSGHYLLTAALVPTSHLAATTRDVRALVTRGNRRTHLSAESKHRRRQLLEGYTAIAVQSRVIVATYRGGDDQAAREGCLDMIIAQTGLWRIAMLVIDTRGPHRDRRDRQFIARAIREGRAPQRLLYAHRGSRDEPLLGIPDAIGWAVGAGGLWRQIVAPVAEVIEIEE